MWKNEYDLNDYMSLKNETKEKKGNKKRVNIFNKFMTFSQISDTWDFLK